MYDVINRENNNVEGSYDTLHDATRYAVVSVIKDGSKRSVVLI